MTSAAETLRATQPAYGWLLDEPAPRHLVEALKLYGVIEGYQGLDNPTIVHWAAELGGFPASYYKHDSIPWCGLFMGLIMHRASTLDSPRLLPKNPLSALDWAQFGTASVTPCLGDVLVFKRTGGGHVALYVGEDDECYHVLGGNQGQNAAKHIDGMVNVTRIAKARLWACRRPVYRAAPSNVRPVHLQAGGTTSQNEA